MQVVVSSVRAAEDRLVFIVQARDPRTGSLRAYQFRAASHDDQKRWVRGLNDHRNYLLAMLRWVAMNKNPDVQINWG